MRWWRICDGCYESWFWRTRAEKLLTNGRDKGEWWLTIPATRSYGIGWPTHSDYLCSRWRVPLFPIAALLAIPGAVILYRVPYRRRGL